MEDRLNKLTDSQYAMLKKVANFCKGTNNSGIVYAKQGSKQGWYLGAINGNTLHIIWEDRLDSRPIGSLIRRNFFKFEGNNFYTLDKSKIPIDWQ